MTDSVIKPFLGEVIDKAILRNEWEKWLRAFTIYLEAEGIDTEKQKRSKLLLLGGVQLQSVVYLVRWWSPATEIKRTSIKSSSTI